MTEEDIKLQYITPAIQQKWGIEKITMETKITDGRINLRGNFAFREKPKKLTTFFTLMKIILLLLLRQRITITLYLMACNKQ